MDWTYQGKKIKTTDDFPPGAIGFIYKITTAEGKYYYGRKTCLSKRKKKLTKKEKQQPENKRKTWKIVTFEYKGWQEYTGSCEPLNDDIANGIKYKKEIVKFCKTKKGLTAWETRYILCEAILDDMSYNGNALGKIFRNNFE